MSESSPAASVPFTPEVLATLTGAFTSAIRTLTEARRAVLDFRPAGEGLDYWRPHKALKEAEAAAEKVLRAAGIDPDAIPKPPKTPIDPIRKCGTTHLDGSTHYEVVLDSVDWQADGSGSALIALVMVDGCAYVLTRTVFRRRDDGGGAEFIWHVRRGAEERSIAQGFAGRRVGFFDVNARGKLV